MRFCMRKDDEIWDVVIWKKNDIYIHRFQFYDNEGNFSGMAKMLYNRSLFNEIVNCSDWNDFSGKYEKFFVVSDDINTYYTFKSYDNTKEIMEKLF